MVGEGASVRRLFAIRGETWTGKKENVASIIRRIRRRTGVLQRTRNTRVVNWWRLKTNTPSSNGGKPALVDYDNGRAVENKSDDLSFVFGRPKSCATLTVYCGHGRRRRRSIVTAWRHNARKSRRRHSARLRRNVSDRARVGTVSRGGGRDNSKTIRSINGTFLSRSTVAVPRTRACHFFARGYSLRSLSAILRRSSSYFSNTRPKTVERYAYAPVR